MTDIYPSNKIPVLDEELFLKHPSWFRGALAYRLLQLLTPKRLTSRLPKVLRIPLTPPGYSLPASWMLPPPFPPGLSLPPGAWFPIGWMPGHPLPPDIIIDTALFFPEGWMPGDPFPPGLVSVAGIPLPASWMPGDPLPPGFFIDTSVFFPAWDSDGDVPPIFIPPWEPGPPRPPPGPYPTNGWLKRFDNSFWVPLSGSWNSSGKYWIPGGDNRLELAASGSWALGFRPSLMKITYDSGFQIHLELDAQSPSPFNKIVDNASYMSSEEQTLLFYSSSSTDDLETLICHMPYHCTNIEFLL